MKLIDFPELARGIRKYPMVDIRIAVSVVCALSLIVSHNWWGWAAMVVVFFIAGLADHSIGAESTDDCRPFLKFQETPVSFNAISYFAFLIANAVAGAAFLPWWVSGVAVLALSFGGVLIFERMLKPKDRARAGAALAVVPVVLGLIIWIGGVQWHATLGSLGRVHTKTQSSLSSKARFVPVFENRMVVMRA